MQRLWKVVGAALLATILGVGLVGAVALAQEDTDTGEPFDFGTRFREALADILGITVEEYDNAVEQAQNQVVDEAVSEGWLTEEQAQLMRWRMAQEPQPGMRGGGHGFDKGLRGMGGDSLLSIAAEQLDMTLTELLTELQGGKSIADLAGEKNVDTQAIVDATVAQAKENLDEAVAEGRITQKQADWQLEQLTTRVTGQLDNTWQDGFPGGGRHGGGMMDLPGMGGF